MQGFWWKLPVLRELSAMGKGFAEVAFAILVGTLLGCFALHHLAPEPSASLFQGLSQIGATLLIAYAIETAWIIRAARRRPLSERTERLGVFVGLGAAGLTSIVFALSLSERAKAGTWNLGDELAFGWVTASLFMLGVMVVLHPLAAQEWAEDAAQ